MQIFHVHNFIDLHALMIQKYTICFMLKYENSDIYPLSETLR